MDVCDYFKQMNKKNNIFITEAPYYHNNNIMDKINKDSNIIYSNPFLLQRKETQKMIKDLREMFYAVDEKIVNTIVVASDGNKILAYNALLFYTEENETYLTERLPLDVIADTSKYKFPENNDRLAEKSTTSPVKSQPCRNEPPSKQTKSQIMLPSHKNVKEVFLQKKKTSQQSLPDMSTDEDETKKIVKKEEGKKVGDDSIKVESESEEPLDIKNDITDTNYDDYFEANWDEN